MSDKQERLEAAQNKAQKDVDRLDQLNYYAGISLESLRVLAANFQHLDMEFGRIFPAEVEQCKQCLVDFRNNLSAITRRQTEHTHISLNELADARRTTNE